MNFQIQGRTGNFYLTFVKYLSRESLFESQYLRPLQMMGLLGASRSNPNSMLDICANNVTSVVHYSNCT